MMNNKIGPRRWEMILYLLPSFLLFSFIVFIPIIFAVYYSQFDWPGGTKKLYIGMDNFKYLMGDMNFWNSFKNNIYLTVVSIIGQLGFAFIFACLLKAKSVKLKEFHRVIAYFPATLSAVVVGFIWTMIYDYNYGILNKFLEFIGLGSLAKIWLAETDGIMMVVSIPIIWQYIGMYLLIILAAMTSISPEVLEMAEIDGANGFQRAIHITLPLIKNTMIISLMLCISGNLKIFDHIYAMTRGGPGYSSNLMAMYAYSTSFVEGKMGYGSAMSIMILILSFILVAGSRVLLTKLTRKGDM